MNDIQEIKNLIFAYAEQLDLGNLGSVAEILSKEKFMLRQLIAP